MGSADVRVFGLVSGQVMVGEVVEDEVGYAVLKYPGMTQHMQTPKGLAMGMIAPLEGKLVEDFGELMERFLFPKSAVMWTAKASGAAINLYFQYCQNLKAQLSGIKVVQGLPPGMNQLTGRA